MRAFALRWQVLVLTGLAVCLMGARRRPRTGSLRIVSMTTEASIFVDGESVGELPLRRPLRLKPGRHTIKINKPGYADYIDTFSIKRGKTTTLEVDLLAIAGVLRLDSEPAGAMVIVDGRERGETPYDGDLKPGERVLELRLPGYSTHKERLVVEAGSILPMRVTLVEEVALPPPDPTPWYGHWWVWAGAAVVVGGVTLAVLNQDSDAPPDPPYIVGIPTVR